MGIPIGARATGVKDVKETSKADESCGGRPTIENIVRRDYFQHGKILVGLLTPDRFPFGLLEAFASMAS